MSTETGKKMSGLEHLRQRLRDAICTPKGSQVMRRDAGCGLFSLLDGNMDRGWMVQCYAAIAECIANPANGFEDFQLNSIEPEFVSENETLFNLSGYYIPDKAVVTVGVAI